MEELLNDPARLKRHIMEALHERARHVHMFPRGVTNAQNSSAVLCLLGLQPQRSPSEPCLIFNKRSIRVKQPGDLCFPGGRVSPKLDALLSFFLKLPCFPLSRWPYWAGWRKSRLKEARRMALVFGTALRESLEEMRLNPLGVQYLGSLPPQDLRIFSRIICPMVGWVKRQKRFFTNWEVESVLYIPLKDLLNHDHYRCYRLRYDTSPEHPMCGKIQDFPCFLYQREGVREVLWGATFRIVMEFLDVVFDFTLQDLGSLPVIHGVLDRNYLRGSG